MQTIGFIGLGKMGAPVATRIQESGFPMVVFDLDEAATRPFLERGARGWPRRRQRWPAWLM